MRLALHSITSHQNTLLNLLPPTPRLLVWWSESPNPYWEGAKPRPFRSSSSPRVFLGDNRRPRFHLPSPGRRPRFCHPQFNEGGQWPANAFITLGRGRPHPFRTQAAQSGPLERRGSVPPPSLLGSSPHGEPLTTNVRDGRQPMGRVVVDRRFHRAWLEGFEYERLGERRFKGKEVCLPLTAAERNWAGRVSKHRIDATVCQ